MVAVGRALAGVARAGDVVVRQGGDEFCVVLPRTGSTAAHAMAARIRDALAGLGDVSSGIGVATFPADAGDADALLELADARLSTDKAAARATRGSQPAAELRVAAPARDAEAGPALSASGRTRSTWSNGLSLSWNLPPRFADRVPIVRPTEDSSVRRVTARGGAPQRGLLRTSLSCY